MHSAIIEILESRGIGEEDREEFFSPKPKLTYDPFLLANMRAGVDLLLQSVDEGKNIVIYGDYDVDGITSTSLMMKTIKTLTDKVSYYIPSRLDEGYGLHKESIDKIHEQGCDLLITVDCGSVSKEETNYAHSLGIETIVTDHHNVTSVRAEGIIINPMLEEDEYPFKGLAGVGVAYKFALAISKQREIPKTLLAELLELATIGTIADIMPMVDENRTIVKYGLKFIHLGCQNKGLRRLIELSGLNYRTLRAIDVSFGIAPRINAAGRLGDATLGVKLFLAEDPNEIERYCNLLIETNQERRSLQDDAYDRSMEIAKDKHENDDFLVLEVDNAHEGVLGIVAGKIRESVNRPCIIVTPNGDNYKGTGRSIDKVNLFDMLDKYREHFISFGGHAAACGFTMAKEEVDFLRGRLNEDLATMFGEDPTLFDVDYTSDASVTTSEFDLELAEAVQMLEPCGKDNDYPLFKLERIKPTGFKYLKDDKKYAKFQIESDDNRTIDCMIFKDPINFEGVIEGNEFVDVIGTIEINEFRNVRKAQMIVKWVLPSEG